MTNILMGCPTGGQISHLTASCFTQAALTLERAGHRTTPLFVSTSSPACSHNRIVAALLKGDCDVLWLVDSDMWFQPEVGTRLLGHDLDIVGCDYRVRQTPRMLTAGLLPSNGAEPHPAPRNFSLAGGLHPVLYVGTGLVMIRRRVFEQVPAPWFWDDQDVGFPTTGLGMTNDYNFCLKAADHGFQTWCDFDASRQVGHIGSQCWMYDRTESFQC